MILGLPTERELETAGADYLFAAMTDAIGIARDENFFREVRKEAGEADLVAEYWTSVRHRLAMSASHVQTGSELLLKARIAGASPYLLLDSQNWPGAAAREDTHFDEFRTIDARSLPQVFNTVLHPRLEATFVQMLDRIRKRRNAIVHAASDRAVPKCEEIVKDVLEVSARLIGDGCWVKIHRLRSSAPPFSRVDHHGQIAAGLLEDFDYLLKLLTPAESQRHLGVSKKARRYLCPTCRLGDVATEIKLSFLEPNTAASTSVYCLACGETHPVARSQCPNCRGSVVDDDGACLSCGAYDR